MGTPSISTSPLSRRSLLRMSLAAAAGIPLGLGTLHAASAGGVSRLVGRELGSLAVGRESATSTVLETREEALRGFETARVNREATLNNRQMIRIDRSRQMVLPNRLKE